ncbi:MAG: carboxypeptidase-like regulatory domain-containing protein, partial [Terriglobia bacterium]
MLNRQEWNVKRLFTTPKEGFVMSKRSVVFTAALCGFAFSLFAASQALAQYGAAIQGTVTDISGAVIAGANVTVVNEQTQVKKQTTSSPQGYYSVTA